MNRHVRTSQHHIRVSKPPQQQQQHPNPSSSNNNCSSSNSEITSSVSRTMNDPHLLAKKLNNEASSLIETGHCEESLVLLTRALKLTRRDLHENENGAAARMSCSYESGIMESTKKIEKQEEEGDCFVYLRPLFIRESSTKGRNLHMGVVILFNLALAHHLMYLEKRECIDKAIRLYELVYQTHGNNLDYASLRLALIVSNNVSQIHRAKGDEANHQSCLQHLLEAVVYVVERGLVERVLNQAEFEALCSNVLPIILNKVSASAA